MKKIYEKYIVKQRDLTDCGAACLLMIIKYYQGNNSIENIRNISGTTVDGTTLLGLYQAANKLGFKAEGYEADLKSIKAHGKPQILHLDTNNMEHFVVLFKYDEKNNEFIIGDPATGLEVYSEETLLKKWRTKICLVLDNTKEVESINNLKNDAKSKLQWVLSFLKEDRSLLFFSSTIGVIMAVFGLSTSVFSQLLIDNIIPEKQISKLIYGIILLSIILLVKNALAYIRGELLLRQRKDFNIRINKYFLQNLLDLPISFFKTRKSGDFISRLHDSFKIQNLIDKIAGTFVIDSLIIIASLAALFFYSIKIGLVALVLLPIYFIVILISNKKITKLQKEVMVNYSNTESNYISLINGISTIKLFGKTDFYRTISESIISTFQTSEYKLGKTALSINVKWSIINSVFSVIIILIAGIAVLNSNLKIGSLIAILGIFAYFLPSVSNIAMIIIPFNESKIAFDRMLEFTTSDKESKEGIQVDSIDTVKIKNLDYRYTGKQLLLKNVNLQINKGEIVTVLGESGSGKSTLVSLLQRIFTYEKGGILVNKNPLESFDLESWRNSIGVISQQPSFFNGRVIDNILMDAYTEEERENLIDFMKKIGIHKYIEKMDYGYDTLVGENGQNISGGQRQIISFARVLYKKPKFIILDEATSAMDRKTESFFIKLIQNIKKEMPILYITHRIELLKHFSNKVYEVIDGRVIESDEYNSLILEQNKKFKNPVLC